jgi:hypothetical protein
MGLAPGLDKAHGIVNAGKGCVSDDRCFGGPSAEDAIQLSDIAQEFMGPKPNGLKKCDDRVCCLGLERPVPTAC